jgi:predicted DNA-binding protein
MPARKKPEEKKTNATIPVRVTASLKKDIDEMAEATGIPTSERVREHLEHDVADWKKRGKPTFKPPFAS